MSATENESALAAAESIRAGFVNYNARFRAITQRARSRFERREWREAQTDLVERIELYDKCIAETAEHLRQRFGAGADDKTRWTAIRDHYALLVEPLLDQELFKTFFNTLTRRFFRTRGVDAAIEFVALDIEPTDRITHPVARYSYAASGNLAGLFRRVLDDYPFAVPYADAERCARRIAAAVAVWTRPWGENPVRAVELLETVFYRERRAYLVGRLFGEERFVPLVIALVNEDDGLRADAVLAARDDVALLFGFTRSYFQADLETVGDAVVFLRTLLPRKPVDEWYAMLGRLKQAKTERYRHFYRHFEGRVERFEYADGERGMVMLVFTLPSYPLVFKLIRDRFAYPKNIVRQDVLDKYQLVFKRDRAGRLVDAQEFRHLRFRRDRFTEPLLTELIEGCKESVIVDGDDLLLTHLYIERRLRPLNLFVQEAPPDLQLRAVLDYGQAIKDLAMSSIFPGDLLFKNFGVSRHGRAIFYDYDELCPIADCRFRAMPTARNDDEEMHHGAWYYVGEHDVFPEQFIEFLGLSRPLRTALMAAHGEIFDVRWWQALQQRLAAAAAPELPPYAAHLRLAY